MAVMRDEKEKLYIQLTDELLGRIHSGHWRPGSQIPTEEELCRSFGVSKITVRRAVANLVMEGHLEKLQGKGTFVRQGPPRAGLSMKTTLVEGVFTPHDSASVSVLEKTIGEVTDEEALRKIGPALDRDVFYLSRIKADQGVPVLVNELFIPLRVCPALRDWTPAHGSVFEFMRDRGAPAAARVTQSVLVGRPGALAGSLNVRATAPCMLVHRLFLSGGGATVAYSRTTARADRFNLESEFLRLG